MAITIDDQGGINSLPTRPVQPPRQVIVPDSTSLAPRLAEYRILLRKDRRRRYLGIAAVAVGVIWLGLATLTYFDAGFPLALPLGIVLTLLLPAVALLYEMLRQPTSVDTALTLDALLDNRQRVLTSVELLNNNLPSSDQSAIRNPQSAMESAQLSSTARMLSAVEPRTLYPARMPAVQLFVAGGLLVLAVGLWLLKGASDDFALAAGGLPPSVDTSGVIATPTADAGLPGADQGAQADPPPGQDGAEGQQPSTLPGDPSGEPGQGTSGSTGQVSPEVAQQQAANSREAEKSLQRLSQALDEQGVTQDIGDSIKQGEYDAAANALADLGDNNDQLSQDAKEALAESLDAAANDSAGTPAMQDAERNAAEALRSGTYGEIKKALDDLSQAVKDTGDDVIPQQDLAKNFPTQSATSAAGAPTEAVTQDPSSEDAQGQQGDSGEQGQQGQPNSAGENQPGASTDGQQAQPGDNGTGGAPTNSAGNDPGANPGQGQGQGNGAGDPNLPGEGSKVEGPGSQDLNPAGDPFALQGNEASDPNNLRPGDGSEPPAMTLEGDAGGAGGATSPSQGGPIDATGETGTPPIDRWGILQRYFSSDPR